MSEPKKDSTQKRKGVRLILPLIPIVVLLLSVGGILWVLMNNYVREPLAVPYLGVDYILKPGSNFSQVIDDLHARGHLRNPQWIRVYIKLFRRDVVVKAGEYEIMPDVSAETLLEIMAQGKVKQRTVTIIPGTDFHKIIHDVQEAYGVKAVLGTHNLSQICRAVTKNSCNNTNNPEGLLMADTYAYNLGDTDQEILTKAYDSLQEELESLWHIDSHSDDLPYKNPYEALILASIIEKEAKLDEEKSKIAGVYIRRLQRNMKLEADPTLIYGLGEQYSGVIYRSQLRSKNNPYNTYMLLGLPPTPIAVVSKSSLLAAFHPDNSDNLYFVAVGDGSGAHIFSATYEEHLKAVKAYRKAKEANSKAVEAYLKY